MAIGDGTFVRAGLDAFLDLLHKFAAPTGERGSILLMSGGLIILGFLFLAFLFRSAIVGDLAPVANARAPAPRVDLPPPNDAARARPPAPPRRAFDAGRAKGREASPIIDRALDELRAVGVEVRILQSSAQWKRVRLYTCASCENGEGGGGCEYERGLLAGVFEAMTGDLAKVHETQCAARGDPVCEFEVRHAPVLEVAP